MRVLFKSAKVEFKIRPTVYDFFNRKILYCVTFPSFKSAKVEFKIRPTVYDFFNRKILYCVSLRHLSLSSHTVYKIFNSKILYCVAYTSFKSTKYSKQGRMYIVTVYKIFNRKILYCVSLRHLSLSRV